MAQDSGIFTPDDQGQGGSEGEPSTHYRGSEAPVNDQRPLRKDDAAEQGRLSDHNRFDKPGDPPASSDILPG